MDEDEWPEADRYHYYVGVGFVVCGVCLTYRCEKADRTCGYVGIPGRLYWDWESDIVMVVEEEA